MSRTQPEVRYPRAQQSRGRGHAGQTTRCIEGPRRRHALISPARAVKKGLKFRPLETTVRDTLAWQATRPAEHQTLRTGLKPEQEAEALAKLRT